MTLDQPEALAVGADGKSAHRQPGTNQVLRRTPAGKLSVVAGTGRAGYSGDGGPAVHAALSDPGGMAVAADGTIYLADSANNRVRAISPRGAITTVAGNGQAGSSGVGGPAVRAAVDHPEAAALGENGLVYVAENTGVQVISPSGSLTTLIDAGPGAITIGGAPAAFFPDAVAIDSKGEVYVGDFSPKLLIEFSPAGHVLNSWEIYVTPAGLSTAPDGAVLVADYGWFAIDRLSGGRFTRELTFDHDSLPNLVGTFRPSGIAVAGNGDVYTDTDGQRRHQPSCCEHPRRTRAGPFADRLRRASRVSETSLAYRMGRISAGVAQDPVVSSAAATASQFLLVSARSIPELGSQRR